MGDYEIDWQAWATLATGIMAVIGAVWVARRQMAITAKQIGISARQVEIEALKVRSDLFEKRFATYEATSEILIRSREHWEDKSKVKAYLVKVRESQWLFGLKVYPQLLEIFENFQTLHLNTDALQRDQATSHGFDPIAQGVVQLMQRWMIERLKTLHEIFEDDMRLSVPTAPIE